MLTATLIVWLITFYFGAGVLFALPFLVTGISRIDPNAKESRLAFRLIIAPGVVALWPFLLMRWIRGINNPIERNPHRKLAK